jgi:hypothetical protein
VAALPLEALQEEAVALLEPVASPEAVELLEGFPEEEQEEALNDDVYEANDNDIMLAECCNTNVISTRFNDKPAASFVPHEAMPLAIFFARASRR